MTPILPASEIRERIGRFIQPHDLGAIIREASPHRELVHFAGREGLVYPGSRLESVPHLELAFDIAKDVLTRPDLFKKLASWLTERTLPFTEKIRELPDHALNEMHQMAGELLKSGRLGPCLWALLCDPRKSAETEIPLLLSSARKILLKEEKTLSQAEGFWHRMKEGIFRRGDKEKAAAMVTLLSEKLRKEEKENAKLLKEKSRLAENNEALTEQTSSLRLSLGDVQRAKELSERKLKDLEEQLKRLEAELENARQNPSSLKERIAALEMRLHHQEGECRRHSYELEKAREKLASNQEERRKLAADLVLKTRALEDLHQKHRKLEEKLNRLSPREHPQNIPLASGAGKEKASVSSAPEKRAGRIGVFLDAWNLFLDTRACSIRLAYDRILETASEGRKLVKAIAFFAVQGDKRHHEKLAAVLRRVGFEARTVTLTEPMRKSGGWESFLTHEVLNAAEKLALETVVLIGWKSGEKLKEKNFRVEGFLLGKDGEEIPTCFDASFNLRDSCFHLSASGESAAVR